MNIFKYILRGLGMTLFCVVALFIAIVTLFGGLWLYTNNSTCFWIFMGIFILTVSYFFGKSY
jgi:hypothetical protein